MGDGVEGYPSSPAESRLNAHYSTTSPVAYRLRGLDGIAHSYVRLIATDAVEASSTTTVINATAHPATMGDRIRFTSGNLTNVWATVIEVTANTITLGQTLSEAPATSDAFEILGFVHPRVDADGTVSVSLSGGSITIPEPLSVDDNGGSLTVDNADITTIAGAVSGSEMQVDIVSDSAGLATAANQLPDGHNVTIDNAAGASAVNIQDGGNSITVDGTITTQAGVSAITYAHTNATIGTSSGTVVAANASRNYLFVQNDSANVVWLNVGGTAVANQGIRITPRGGFFEMTAGAGNVSTVVVNGIADAASSEVLITEGT